MGNAVSKLREMLAFKNSQKCTYRFKKKIFARRKMHMREMIHFLRAIKTVPSVFIHHTHEIKNKYWRKGDTYLEMKF